MSIPRTWTSTLKLPKSTFPARTPPTSQPSYLQRCTDDLYAWQTHERAADESPFILHDGPPYANGELHIGHALNKILKDIINRVQLGRGRRVRYVPGWDCHGLPIELKALQGWKEREQGKEGGSQADGGDGDAGPVSAAVIRKKARALAEKTVKKQMAGFRGFGVMGDWAGHWKTMDKGFEKRQLGVFREMVDKGLIYRRYKPVYWSPSTGTALAEAELEYNEGHVSTAALVAFPLVTVPTRLAGNEALSGKTVSAVIWTTTPWTLPANAAIAVHEDLEYAIVESGTRECMLIAQPRLEYLRSELKEDLAVIVSGIRGSELAHETTYRPLFKDQGSQAQPMIAADFVTADSGSGLVHCAPGHGMQDYEACTSCGIPAFAPVNDNGEFTDDAMPSDPGRLSGKSVLKEGNDAALEYVRSQGQLLTQASYKHKYPYDWRSKLPIIIRATEQWFADVGDIRDSAVRALQDVNSFPETGKQRLESFLKNRSEWCISRQRAWGVPIPALYHRQTGEAVLSKDTVSHIMAVIEERGVDAWWTDGANDPAWIPQSLQDASGPGYRRGTDTMDVWFDSGTSWTEIDGLVQDKGHLADVYLEGTDQHRGWFQSGLLTYIAHQISSEQKTTPQAPFKSLVTHGFTLDENGRKMSKSLGNVIEPQAIMDGTLLPPLKPRKGKGKQQQLAHPRVVYDALGPDALRMWVASSDYTRDVAVGKQVLHTVHTSLHKYRMTFKLLTGALSDFDTTHIQPYDSLRQNDKIALNHISGLVHTCQKTCENFEFYKAVNAINRWANLEFSAFYMETIKDRLYADAENSSSRRAAQTTLFHLYRHLQELLAPITPLLIEESWEHTPNALRSTMQHPLQRTASAPAFEWHQPSLQKDFEVFSTIHATVKQLQEQARGKKEMGSSLESFVHIILPDRHRDVLVRLLDELADMFVVSRVTLGSPDEPFVGTENGFQYMEAFELAGGVKGEVIVYKPSDHKCPRCWKYNVRDAEGSLCGRCDDVVAQLDAAAGN